MAAGRVFDLAIFKEFQINLAFDQFILQHIGHVSQLKIIFRKQSDVVAFFFDLADAALEVKALGDLLDRHLNGIVNLLEIRFGNYVKRTIFGHVIIIIK